MSFVILGTNLSAANLLSPFGMEHRLFPTTKNCKNRGNLNKDTRSKRAQRWMNCMELIAPRKNTVGTTRAWMASQRKVKIG